jgi:tetratricopeptide (TPR) repeat protein
VIREVQDDERVMSLVEFALSLPSGERATRVRSACAGDGEFFSAVWSYVEAEDRMKGFLLEPLLTAEPEHRFHPGELLEGRFRILREIAQGGMGVVYEAFDEKLQRRIALKSAKARYRKRLTPEVRHASEISHPNICRIFEIHTTATARGEIDFITMEFLEGETLTQRLKRGPLPEREARIIALQLCAGLAEAHRNGVVHGDLKTSNVILTAQRAVITDFGLAHAHDSAAPVGGTPGYMAPELWRGGAASAASDIFALGVILYEMLAGFNPHNPPKSISETEPTATMAHRSNPIEFWPERLKHKPRPVNPKWDRVLLRCLDPDPARRPANADEVARALGPSRTRRVALVTAAALALAAISGWITYERSTAPAQTVNLAVAQFSGPGADALQRDTAAKLGQIQSDARTRFRVTGVSKATHVLRASLSSSGARITLDAAVVNARNQVNVREWKVEYEPSELKFAPGALAGLVTWSVDLPSLGDAGTVRSEAQTDYQSGLNHLRGGAGQADAALADFTKAVAADSDSALTHAGLAEAQWFKYFPTRDKNWLAVATESARRAELRNPDLAAAHRIKGKLIANVGRYEVAIAEYLRAKELEPDNGELFRRLGQAYEGNNQLDEALGAYKHAIELDPTAFLNHQELGAFYFKRSDFTKSVEPFQRAVELAPREPGPHFALGSALENLGRFPEAERELRLSIQLGETPAADNTLARVLMFEGKDSEAIPWYERALKLNPERVYSWVFLGVALRRSGKAQDAERAWREGLKFAEATAARSPRDGNTRAYLAYLCGLLGERSRAESEIEQALQLSPTDEDVRAMAVYTYESLKERDASLRTAASLTQQNLENTRRWPDLADLSQDSRFSELLKSKQMK